MLYELIAIVRPGRLAEVKEIASITGKLILSNAGVIRSLNNWGQFLLTSPIRAHQKKHITGHHFVMRFDSNPSTVDHLRTVLAKDPRVLRTGMVKLEGSGKHTGTLRGMANISDIVWSRRTQGMSSVKKQDAGGLVAGYSNP